MVSYSRSSARHAKVPTVGLCRSKSPPSALYPGANSFARSTDLFAPSEVVSRVRIRFASTASPTTLPPWSDCLRLPTAPRVCEGIGLSCTVAVGGEPSGRIDVTVHHDALQLAYGGVLPGRRCGPAAASCFRSLGRRAILAAPGPCCGATRAAAAPQALSRHRFRCCLPRCHGRSRFVEKHWNTHRRPPTRRRRHSGLTVALNWPTVYFANAFSPIKLSSGEDFGD
jgi:hypothetical protein